MLSPSPTPRGLDLTIAAIVLPRVAPSARLQLIYTKSRGSPLTALQGGDGGMRRLELVPSPHRQAKRTLQQAPASKPSAHQTKAAILGAVTADRRCDARHCASMAVVLHSNG